MKIRVRKGLNLAIAGGVDAQCPVGQSADKVFAITPDDYPGFAPKVAVKEGEKVLIGSPLLFDKNRPNLKLVSPVSGIVKAVVRGERRKILRVEVESDLEQSTTTIDTTNVREALAESGLLALVRQRPYDVVPDPNAEVRDIFVTAVDSAPLAMPMTIQLGADAEKMLSLAVAKLRDITSGKVYISYTKDFAYSTIPGAEMVEVEGPHPAGNPSTIISNIKPINKGDVVWTLDVVTLYRIGKLFATGTVDSTTTIAVVGPEVESPTLIKTYIGASVATLVSGKISQTACNKRVISGNVLTGSAVGQGDDAFLLYPYRQITVIANGDDVDEFMGWASLAPKKMSVSRSFPGHFLSRLFKPDARLNGGRRAMIMSGVYDKVFPMDILPEYLIKAIIAKNIEEMENLGIYEVAPEDFALAEYVDPSKLPLQQIVRDGLDYLRKELE